VLELTFYYAPHGILAPFITSKQVGGKARKEKQK